MLATSRLDRKSRRGKRTGFFLPGLVQIFQSDGHKKDSYENFCLDFFGRTPLCVLQ